MDSLHWSLDYGHQFGADEFRHHFLQSLARFLRLPAPAAEADRVSHRYSILPNFWAGYNRSSPEESLEIGDLVVVRESVGAIWSYRVRHRNHLSGEDLTLEFTCGDDQTRTLQSPWQIRAVNESDGSYSGIEWSGRFERQDGSRKIILKTNRGLSLAAASLPDDTPVTCNWALLDLIPRIGQEEISGIAVLEDLEMVHEQCCVRSFATWEVEIEGRQHDLQGYIVFGTGMAPAYWWVTETGDVAAFSTMLATYVLSGRQA